MRITVEHGPAAPAVDVLDPASFDELKVVISPSVSVTAACDALRRVGEVRADGQVWIRLQEIERMVQLHEAAEWDRALWADGFSKMLRSAATRGWVDDERRMVAVHCERNGTRIELEGGTP